MAASGRDLGDVGQKTHAGRRGPWPLTAGHRGLGAGLVGVWVRTGDVRENSGLREFLFVVLRVDLEGTAAARASVSLTAPLPERPSARTVHGGRIFGSSCAAPQRRPMTPARAAHALPPSRVAPDRRPTAWLRPARYSEAHARPYGRLTHHRG